MCARALGGYINSQYMLALSHGSTLMRWKRVWSKLVLSAIFKKKNWNDECTA